MEVGKDLPHELALFVQDIEELRLFTVRSYGLYWDSERTNFNIRKTSKKL